MSHLQIQFTDISFSGSYIFDQTLFLTVASATVDQTVERIDITTQRISPASAGGGFYLTKQSEYNLRLSGNRFYESPLLVKSRALNYPVQNDFLQILCFLMRQS